MSLTDNRVAQWNDRSGHGRHAVQASYWARPVYSATGWNGTQPTVTFNGNILAVQDWLGAPIGTNAAFTVLAVVRSAMAQDAAVASWWTATGGGEAWAAFKPNNGQTHLDLTRVFQLGPGQMYEGSQDLGTQRHALVWRYAPVTETLSLAVDGSITSSSSMPPIGDLPSMPLIIGAKSDLPTGLFHGDLSELVIVPAAISDEDIQNFTDYARQQWQDVSPQNTAGPCFDASGQPSPSSTRCDDGNPATYGDHCVAGVCAGSAPVAGSPVELSPSAWYRAGAQEVALTDGTVSTWFDRTSNHLDLFQAFYYGRPALALTGWPGSKPTLHFNNGAIWRHAWGGTPAGSNAAFSVLAVFRSGVTTQDAGIASWWHSEGASRVSCKLKHAGGMALDLFRYDSNGVTQEFAGTTDVAADIHAAVWRYAPEGSKLTLDGSTQTTSGGVSLAPLGFNSFLVGASTFLPTDLFTGDISELAVVPRSITDTEVNTFERYAHDEWGVPLQCSPDCVGKWCGASDGCGGTCECPPQCDPSAPFDPPQPAFTGTTLASSLAFARDGRTVYVTSKAGSAAPPTIRVATRASVADAFGPLTPVSTLASGYDDRGLSLTDDGLSLYLASINPANSSRDLAVATRASTNVQFGGAQFLAAPNTTGFDEQDPFFLSPTHELYFASESPSGTRDIYVSALVNGAYGSPTGLSVNAPGVHDYRPLLSRDGLTLYFASTRPGIGGDTQGDVWMAKRSSANQPFGPATNLYGLNSSYVEFPVALTDGDCTLYFASSEETGNPQDVRLYRATRGSSTPAAVTTTLQIIGNGSVNTPPFQCATTCVASGAPDSTVTLDASGPAFWSGSCTGNNGNPSSDGILVFTNGGVCTVNFQGGGSEGGPGDPCLIDANCVDGLSCDSGVCTGDCCQGRTCGDVIPAACGECRGLCANGDPNCHSDAECPQGSICAQGVGDRYGQPPNVAVCMPAGCLAYNPELPSCGVSDPACGECLPPPESTYCGDAIRGPADEECDDGPGTAPDACSEDCHLTDAPVAPVPRVDGERRGRSLDQGRHPIASTFVGTLVAYTEFDDSNQSLRGALFGIKGQPLSMFEVGAGAFPSEYADPSIAAIEPNRFVVAWNDLDQGSLDVAMRVVEAGSSAVTGNVVLANATTAGAQQDPDLVWTGSELVAAWTSELAIVARRFDAKLVPIEGEEQLSPSGESSGSVALGRFGTGWAAAWRATSDEGQELIRVHAGSVDWSVGPFVPGAPGERPALVELDASNLLVVFSEGTDPFQTGTPALTRLRGAILNVAAPGSTESFALQASNQGFSASEFVSQSRPTLTAVGTKLFLGWETGALTADPLSAEVWVQGLSFDSVAGLTYGAELPIPETAGREGAQRAPAFAASPLLPDGALAIAWEQHAESWPYGARPDVVFALRPLPFELPAGCTRDSDCAANNQFCANGACETRSCNLADAFGSVTRVLPGNTSTDGMTLAPDGLTAYFSRRASSDYDIYVATRADTSAAFGPLNLVPSLNSSYSERAPTLSPDGLQLFFWTGTFNNGLGDVVVATRSSPAAAFGTPQLVANVNSSVSDEDPYLSLGGQTLLFASDRSSEDQVLYSATKTGTGFDAPVLVPLTHVSGWDDTHPVLGSDGLRLYFRSGRPGGYNSDGDGDLWMAERASTAASFGTPVNLTSLNSTGVEFPVTLSADGCSLYFASNREHGAGGVDTLELYQAKRQPAPNQVTVQLNVTGGAGDNVGSPYACAAGNTGTCAATRTFGSELIVYGNRQANWSGACRPNGPNPSTDGVVLFTVDGVCNVAFP